MVGFVGVWGDGCANAEHAASGGGRDGVHEGVCSVAELRGKLEAWMREQQDTKKMFNEPIPLTVEGRPAIPALPRPQTSP
jgi:hypothetical protein